MNVPPNPNVEATPCHCSMRSKYMANVPTYLMSGVWTFGIGFTFVKIEIIVETTQLSVAIKLLKTLIQYLSKQMRFRDFFAYAWCCSIDMHEQLPSRASGLNFHTSFHLHTFIVYKTRECSGDSAYVRRLAWAFITGTCDKHLKLICWLISVSLHVTLSW